MHGLNLLLFCWGIGLLVGRSKKTKGVVWDLFIAIFLMLLLSICVTWVYAPLHLDFPYYESLQANMIDHLVEKK